MKKNSDIKREAQTFQKWKKKRKLTIILIAVLSLTLSLIVGVVVGYSWFADANSSAKRDLKVTDFSASMQISINGSTGFEDLSDTLITKSDFSNLRLNINYTGESSAYIRVKLFESFYDSEGAYLAKSVVEYTTDSKWEFNPSDGYYYYKDIVSGATVDTPLTIEFVTGGANISTEAVAYSDTDGFKLNAIIEEVQPDRFNEFFGYEPEDIIG
ncbi:MAG: hypothetical protein E7652_07310 [Ruminococcaceae bacterium]|nr:hypothetical protein [Oscillospiraceae bacterium]